LFYHKGKTTSSPFPPLRHNTHTIPRCLISSSSLPFDWPDALPLPNQEIAQAVPSGSGHRSPTTPHFWSLPPISYHPLLAPLA
jgi:hypothetical protein